MIKTEKPVKLQNIYNSEIVICDKINEIYQNDGIPFIKVYRESHPSRTFLVNKDAFKKVK
jgi:hypothetical protein